MLLFLKTLIRRHVWLAITTIFFLTLTSLLGVISIFSIAPVIDILLSSDPQAMSQISMSLTGWLRNLGISTSPLSICTIFLVLNVLKALALVLTQYALLLTKFTLQQQIVTETFRDVFRARWEFFSTSRQGWLINTFSREIASAGDSIGAITRMGAAFVQMTFYLFVPLYISWQITAVAVLLSLALALPLVLLQKASKRLGARKTQANNEFSSFIQEQLTLAKTIMGFGNQSRSIAKFQDISEGVKTTTLKCDQLITSIPIAYEPLGIIAILAAAIVARNIGLAVGEIGIIVWALKQLLPNIGMIISQRNLVYNFKPSFEQVQDTITKAREFRQFSGTLPFSDLKDGIVVNDLHFSYNTGVPALRGVSLRINKGEMIAIVGPSGSGKTTLAESVMGFYEPDGGQIAIDGIPLPSYDIESFRQRIGYVPQDIMLFNATIRENLLWARPEATRDDIEAACELANSLEFIVRLPEGYDTVVGDRGVKLSGGQRQRIALARAVLRKPELLILDEATSALDTHSERMIQQAIERLAHRTTTMVIAHRMSTISTADRIFVLLNGVVVETGTYDQLLGRGGPFCAMVRAQSIASGVVA